MLVNLIERHRVALLAVALALAAAGLFAGITLPVGLFPVTSFPRVRIEVDAGAMPADQTLVEVTQPLEQAARAVPRALDVESTTSRGAVEIFVDFPWGSDMNQALLSVLTAIAQTLPQLPPGTSYEAIQMSPNVLMPFVSYALISDTDSPEALRRLAQYQIAPRLTGIPGIRRVGVLGGQTPEIQVHVTPQQLQAYGLTFEDVSKAIAATNSITAVGRQEDNDLLYLAINNNAFTSLQAVRDVAIKTGSGGVLRLADFAKVELGTVPQWLTVNDNGKPAVTFDVYQQDSADSLTLAKAVEASLSSFMQTQPKSIQVYKWYDQTQLVRSSISAVEEAILIGIVLAAVVVFGFLRSWRVALVAMAIVPLSVLITVLLLYLLGMSLNIMTLGGVAAAIGLLIDDAIVMIEHIARRAGTPGLRDAQRAVFPAAREFLRPLLGSSLATIIIFAPLSFLSGVTGAFFRFLSLTMASALVISFVLTALIVPLLAHRLIDFQAWHDPVQERGSRLTGLHRKLLARLFRHPSWIAVSVVVLVGVGILAYSRVGTGFLPRMDEGGFVLDYQTAPGTSLAESNRELEQVEALLKADPNVFTYSRRTGAGLGGDLKETYQGDFFVRLTDNGRRPPAWTVMDELSDKITSQVPGIQIDPHQLLDDMIGDMVGRPEPVVIQLSAQNPQALGATAVTAAHAIAQVPGIVPDSVNSGVIPAGDALEIHVDPAAAAAFGTTPDEVQDQVNDYLSGEVVTRYLARMQDVGVRLWLDAPLNPPRVKPYRDEIGQLLIRSSNGHVFPLQSVAQVSFVSGQPEINRDNLAQIVPITAEISGGHDLGSTLAAVQRTLERPGILPRGVYYTIGGAYKQQQLAMHDMIVAFAAAAIAEFVLLLFLYGRIWIPVLILASAVVSSSAVFIGLWITHIEFNITAMMGTVMIIGIATEMAIFLASEYQLLVHTKPAREALQAAAINRLRPITMSTLAMILALLPLGAAVSGSGDQMLQPLAIAIIAGVIVQLPLVLLAMPVALEFVLRTQAPAEGQAR